MCVRLSKGRQIRGEKVCECENKEWKWAKWCLEFRLVAGAAVMVALGGGCWLHPVGDTVAWVGPPMCTLIMDTCTLLVALRGVDTVAIGASGTFQET